MGLIEEVNDLKKELRELKGEEPKPKPFKIPFWKRIGGRAARKNYVTVISVNENGHANFFKEQINEQTVMIDKIPRLATAEHIIQYGKNPIMIIPSWSVQPISWKENYNSSLLNGSNTAGYQLLMNAMELNKSELGKKKMGGWMGWIIGIIVLGVIGYALFTGGI
jgi:hypothetical protein